MSNKRPTLLRSVGVILFGALLLVGLLPATASAHVRGKPSFLKIGDSFVDYYNVKPSSGAKREYPQSMDINYHLPGQSIGFSIDKRLMAVSYDQVDRMRLNWDFGDGSTASGFSARHSYSQPGTYELRITGELPGAKSQLVEATSVQIFPSNDYKLPDFTMRVNGREVFNNTDVTKILPQQDVSLAIIQHDDHTLQSVEWDFGDGSSSDGASVSHRYAADFQQAYPVVRVYFDDRFYLDNQVWLQNPNAQPSATTDPSSAAAPTNSSSPLARMRHSLEANLNTVFKDGKINLALAAFVLCFAIIAGSLHSLTPGHGKTILAALLIGKGTSRYRDLAILTASITIAHTVVIYGIGFVLLTVSRTHSANSLLPYFEKASALLVILLAFYLIYNGVRTMRHQVQHHTHNHHHSHAADSTPSPAGRDTWTLIVAGAGGGIVPCIDALSLMLLAAGLGHAGFGLVLVAFFSLGLAGTIAVLGLLIVAGKSRLAITPSVERFVGRYAPLTSGIVILLLAIFTLWPH